MAVDPVIVEAHAGQGIDDDAGRLLEVGVTGAVGVDVIVQAMTARPEFLET